MLAYILALGPSESILPAIMILIIVFFATHPKPSKKYFKDFSAKKPSRQKNADSRRYNSRPAKDKHIVVRQSDHNKQYSVNRYGEVFEE